MGWQEQERPRGCLSLVTLMKGTCRKRLSGYVWAACLVLAAAAQAHQRSSKPIQAPVSASDTNLAQLVSMVHEKAEGLANSSGMRSSFQSFTSARGLSTESIRYSDFVIVRLLYEATRDAGFWNVHWTITDQPPNSDKIWKQWLNVAQPSPLSPTASAECDELSALFAFLAEREGVKGVGLFWPAPNHTVAVWVLRPPAGPVIRVVVPTSQIFLEASDSFDTRSSIRGARKRFTNTRVATFRTRLNFPNHFSASFFSR